MHASSRRRRRNLAAHFIKGRAKTRVPADFTEQRLSFQKSDWLNLLDACSSNFNLANHRSATSAFCPIKSSEHPTPVTAISTSNSAASSACFLGRYALPINWVGNQIGHIVDLFPPKHSPSCTTSRAGFKLLSLSNTFGYPAGCVIVSFLSDPQASVHSFP